MEAYQERVIEEKRELDEKIECLVSFVRDRRKMAPVLLREQMQLMSQLTIMRAYSSVLEDRIACFNDFPMQDPDYEVPIKMVILPDNGTFLKGT